MLLDRLHEAAVPLGSRAQMIRLCSGPGMVPLAMAVCACDTVRAKFFADGPEAVAEEEVLDQAVSEEDEEEEAAPELASSSTKRRKHAFDDLLNKIKASGSVPAWAHRQSVKICQILLHVLHSSKFLKICCRLAECDLKELLTYDLMEYCLCEHRRLICKLKKRVHRKPLKKCNFTSSHKTNVGQVRAAMIKYLLKKHA